MHIVENEKELVLKSKQGDNLAFGMLYDRYIKRIYNFVFYKTYNKEIAEDITSQTFFKALNNIQSVDPERSFSSWLYKIAQNTVIDHYRKDRPTQDIDDVWDISDETDFVHDIETDLQFKKVKKHLDQLSLVERDIIIMRVWQDMSYKEIAEVVGKTEANCKMIYSRSIKKLREMMPVTALGIFVLFILKM